MSDAPAKPTPPGADFWKRKLLAFLHDPPCKAMDISNHEAVALSFAKAAIPGWVEGSDDDLFTKLRDTDWTAAAADRFTFPRAKTAAAFSGRPGSTFRHPLGGSELELALPPTAAKAEEILQHAFGGIKAKDGDFRTRFFFYWRRWMEEVAKSDGGSSLAYFPADTRIPDHTIWTHMSVASALQACRVGARIEPAFLVFQIGPVQEFIAAARSTRDLWSGSYLLSWLIAHAIKAVTDLLGPDNVIFPALRGQGIFDVLHRDLYQGAAYADGTGGEDTLWERMYMDGKKHDRERLARVLLNPTLPNRFLALVPATGEYAGARLAAAAEQAVRDELGAISAACWRAFATLANDAGQPPQDGWQLRWDKQVELWPQITWAVVPWEHDINTCLTEFAKLPINTTNEPEEAPAAILHAFHDLATKTMDVTDRDWRYYADGYKDNPGAGKTHLNNPGFLWSANVQTAEFAIAARRNTREFAQFVTDTDQDASPKDALTGKEEIIGSEKLWEVLSAKSGGPFKGNEGPYGAITLIKRLWCRQETDYLFTKLEIDDRLLRSTLRFESVEDVAKGNDDASPYVAIIAMDGDRMGKWISGAETPAFVDQLAQSARPYFTGKIPANLRRPLSPSYHMQFSEALANFANHVAGRIVRRYEGQLLYAGGDDVLAMLPADKALRCAQALRAAFRGRRSELPDPENTYDLAFEASDGFLRIDQGYPIVVPGPRAEVSCGIAIGHFKHPLQALIREAHLAENRAKRDHDKDGFGRSAFAISLLKRGGETVRWGAQWNSPALELYHTYCRLRGRTKAEKDVSPIAGKFPYALAGLLQPYALAKGRIEGGFDPLQIIPIELEHVLDRQVSCGLAEKRQVQSDLREPAIRYLKWLLFQFNAGRKGAFSEFADLFLATAFIERDRSEEA